METINMVRIEVKKKGREEGRKTLGNKTERDKNTKERTKEKLRKASGNN
jgi:hypothetical protein